MAKKKAKAEKQAPENELEELDNLFVGGEEDDLSGMEYIQDETMTDRVETHPPETKDEADALAEQAAAEEKSDDKTDTDGDITAEGEEETSAEEKSEEAGKGDEESAEEAEDKTDSAETGAKEDGKVVDDELKIPKERFDEVNDRMKAAEAKVETLQTQLESAVEEEEELEPYDYKAKEAEAVEAMLEGDAEKYSAVHQEIRTAEKAEYLREAKKLAAQGDQQLQESLTFEEAGVKIEADYPAFAETSEVYDKAAREELLDLYVGYAQSGIYTRVQALQRAADKAAKIHGLVATTEQEEEVPDNVVDIKKPDVEKKAGIANAQPPVAESTSKDKEEPQRDFGSMSDEEFEALPESTKRRARGDYM